MIGDYYKNPLHAICRRLGHVWTTLSLVDSPVRCARCGTPAESRLQASAPAAITYEEWAAWFGKEIERCRRFATLYPKHAEQIGCFGWTPAEVAAMVGR